MNEKERLDYLANFDFVEAAKDLIEFLKIRGNPKAKIIVKENEVLFIPEE